MRFTSPYGNESSSFTIPVHRFSDLFLQLCHLLFLLFFGEKIRHSLFVYDLTVYEHNCYRIKLNGQQKKTTNTFVGDFSILCELASLDCMVKARANQSTCESDPSC